MIQNNYFSDNKDIMAQFQSIVDWNEVVQAYEDGFKDAAEYAKTSEVLETSEVCLRLTKRGRLLGNQVFLRFV